jgi:hypothetical protein
MWEFAASEDPQQPGWRWARISERGITYQRSPATFDSLGKALGNAMLYGFDGTQDKFRLVGLE